MSDIEITRLCAKAMGYHSILSSSYPPLVWFDTDSQAGFRYDPLHDDAQAMALVKKFSLQIHHHGFAGSRASLVTVSGKWLPYGPEFRSVGKDDDGMNAENKAICECVAKMQIKAA